MPTPERIERISKVVEQRQEGIVLLEDIHDPHNAQAVIRSCDCFGIQTIYFVFDKERQFDPDRIGKLASSSANKWLDYKIFYSTEEAYKELKDQGYQIITTIPPEKADLSRRSVTKAESIYTTDLCKQEKIALAFGNEHSGLSDYAIENADRNLIIPMGGMIKSLNLSVTAAICLYELNRQRKEIGIEKFLLKEQDQKELSLSLLER